ncbi:MAG: hypothetical protein R3349_10880 [Geminicoccaceae bacterium]|nr:hypothetical protein [Geminicoccaceae bacterium]
MTTHVIAEYQAPAAVFEVIEDSDFFCSSYYVRDRRSGRVVRGSYPTKRRALAAAEAEARRSLNG